MLRCLYVLADRWRQRICARRWDPDRALGALGEDMAHRFLQRQGMVVIARNWRPRPGAAELDLVARDGDTLVFVEVKSRQTSEFGAPDRAIDRGKRRRLAYAAREYARRADWDWRHVRFDLVSIVFQADPPICHQRDAFRVTDTTAGGL